MPPCHYLALLPENPLMHQKEKIKQHYVSRLYLNNWRAEKATKNPSIWVLNKNTGKIFKTTNTFNISQENRFYKVVIDDIVLDVLEYLFHLKKNEPFVATTMQVLEVLWGVNYYRENKLEEHEKLAAIETNFLEDRYADLENRFAHTIKKISAADRGVSWVFKENLAKHYENLILFFATQYLRSQQARQRLNDLTKDMCLQRNHEEEYKLSPLQVDTVSKISLYVESVRFAENLLRSNFKIALEYNFSNIDLVTSSSPALGCFTPSDTPDDITSFRGNIPLSPKINMRLYQSSDGGKQIFFRALDEKKVLLLNRFQVENSDMDVYATSEQQLQLSLKLLTL